MSVATILTSFIIGSLSPAYATDDIKFDYSSYSSTEAGDQETEYMLNQMASEFESQYLQNPESFDRVLDNLSKSFSGQSSLQSVFSYDRGLTPYASWENYAKCVGNGVAAAFGIDILKRAINKPVVDALKSRQWRVASSIIHSNLKRILGSKGASLVIKKIANKALPGGLPGQIVWIAGKCGVKEFI